MQKEKFSEWPLTDVFGICRQTILPIYRQHTFNSALVTQLLFGECYQVLTMSSDQQWFKILHEDTGYSGYIPSKLLKEIPGKDYQTYLTNDFQVVTSPIAAIEYTGTNLYLLPGSRLHFSDLELFNWRDHIGFTGSVRSHASLATREQLIDIALKFINSPFQPGGRSIFGMDEKQVFPLIFLIAGYNWNTNKSPGKIVAAEEVLPGDVMIVTESEEEKKHYALYLGAEEVLWMDNRMRVSDFDEWLAFTKNIPGKQIVLESRNLIG
jgi:gamma-D-glutamyl-L-lysine dipeptidyl-peptidase